MVKGSRERTHDGRAIGSSSPAATASAVGGSSDLVRLRQNIIDKRKVHED
jgi:hypothetical protein